MENKITFYKLNGDIDNEKLLNEESLRNTNGMMLKCYMKNGIEESQFVPFADVEITKARREW